MRINLGKETDSDTIGISKTRSNILLCKRTNSLFRDISERWRERGSSIRGYDTPSPGSNKVVFFKLTAVHSPQLLREMHRKRPRLTILRIVSIRISRRKVVAVIASLILVYLRRRILGFRLDVLILRIRSGQNFIIL